MSVTLLAPITIPQLPPATLPLSPNDQLTVSQNGGPARRAPLSAAFTAGGPGGSTGALQYNADGVFGGASFLTISGTTLTCSGAALFTEGVYIQGTLTVQGALTAVDGATINGNATVTEQLETDALIVGGSVTVLGGGFFGDTVQFESGVEIGAPTGGMPAAGTINAQQVLVNGSVIPGTGGVTQLIDDVIGTNAAGTIATTVVAIGGKAVDLGGPLTTGGTVTVSGADTLLLDLTGNTTLTLPTSGALMTDWVLVDNAGTQTITQGATATIIAQGTALASADIWVGNSGGTAQARAMSGDAEISNTGVVTVVSAGGDAFGSLAFLSAAPAGTLTGTTLASNVVNSSLTEVGTIATGVWEGTALTYPYLPASADIATIPFSFIGLLNSGQVYAIPVSQAGTLLANGGSGFTWTEGALPTATQTLLVQTINQGGTGTTLGTISISTAGSVTAPTYVATAYAGSGGVALKNQATADATFANWSFGLQFQKT